MANSLKITDVAAYQAYVQKYRKDIITKLFFGFPSSQIVKPLEGVKGKITLTQMVAADLARRWSIDFNVIQDALAMSPRTLSVEAAKIDLKFYPQELEQSYLGDWRQQGFSIDDNPFEAQAIDLVLRKKDAEMEVALWQGVAAAVPAQTDKLIALIDGFQHIISDAVTALTVTPVATGALTSANAYTSLEAVYATLGPAYLAGEMDCFVAPSTRIKMLQEYREKYGKYTNNPDGTVSFNLGNLKVHSLPGVGADFILITPRENLLYGYDGQDDSDLIVFEKDHRSIDMMIDWKLGCQIASFDSDLFACNDQY